MQQLNPKVLIVYFIKNALSTIYIIPIWWIAVGILDRVWNPLPGVLPKEQIISLLNGVGVIFLILLIVGTYYGALLSYKFYTYAVQNDGLHIYHGVIFKHHTVLPFGQMQNVDIYINPLLTRFLGLYYVHIRTSQRENTEGIIHKATNEQLPGMTQEEATQLRNQLITYSHVQTTPKRFFDPTTGMYK